MDEPAPDPCAERLDELANQVGAEIEKVWTNQESEAEALVRIDELVAIAAGRPEAEGSLLEPQEAEKLRARVREWHPATKPLADRPPLPAAEDRPQKR